MKYLTHITKTALVISIIALSGCATTVINRNTSVVLSSAATTLVAPFTNNSETPEAGTRASTMLANLLRANGITNVVLYHPKKSCNPLKTCANSDISETKLQKLAAKRHYQYLVTGSVNEWRYKVGLDGEPSVGLSVVIRQVSNNQPIWTSVGSRTGHSWSGLSDTAQRLYRTMLSNIYVRR